MRDAVAHSCPRRRSRPTGRTTIRRCAARLQISPDCRAKLAATSLPPVHACALLPVTVVPANADRAAVAEAPRAMSALQPLLCKTCAKRAAVGRCGNCFAVGYCSVACMRSHRAAHEPFCRLLRSVTSVRRDDGRRVATGVVHRSLRDVWHLHDAPLWAVHRRLLLLAGVPGEAAAPAAGIAQPSTCSCACRTTMCCPCTFLATRCSGLTTRSTGRCAFAR